MFSERNKALQQNETVVRCLPLIQTYAAAETAKISKNRIKRNVSRLLAVTRLTPNKIVLSSFPCQKHKYLHYAMNWNQPLYS